MAFGRGLMSGSVKPRETWLMLLGALRALDIKIFNYGVLSGALDELSKSDRPLVDSLLDEAASDNLLMPIIVGLHPYAEFSNADFDRCLNVLDSVDGHANGFEILLWQDRFQDVEYEKSVSLAKSILRKENGDFTLLDAMSMRLHDKPTDEGVIGEELRKLALQAAVSYLAKDDLQSDGMGDYRLTQVLSHCLPYSDCDEEKVMLLDTLFDDQSGAVRDLYQYGDAVAEMVKHLIGPFLSRALLEGDMQDYLRFRAFEGGSHSKNPLEDVSPVDLVNWCRNAGDERAWALVSNAIAPFGSCHKGGTVELSEQAVAILRNAPEPLDVLKIYIEAVSPMSWFDSRADIMAGRIAALASLDIPHSNNVKALLKAELPRLQKIEREERKQETNRDRESEQRFVQSSKLLRDRAALL